MKELEDLRGALERLHEAEGGARARASEAADVTAGGAEISQEVYEGARRLMEEASGKVEEASRRLTQVGGTGGSGARRGAMRRL